LPEEEKEQQSAAQEARQPFECPRCGSEHMKRTRREGFLKRRICSIFGYYPWRCTKCLGNFLLKKRALPRRHRASMEIAEQAADSGASE